MHRIVVAVQADVVISGSHLPAEIAHLCLPLNGRPTRRRSSAVLPGRRLDTRRGPTTPRAAERDQLMALDGDPDVVGVLSQGGRTFVNKRPCHVAWPQMGDIR